MSESINAVARERLEALIGEWTLEAGLPGGPPGPVRGGSPSGWLDGAPCWIERWCMWTCQRHPTASR